MTECLTRFLRILVVSGFGSGLSLMGQSPELRRDPVPAAGSPPLSVNVNADILLLKNGDTLRGRFVERRDDGTVVFESPVLGRLELPKGAAQVLGSGFTTPGEKNPVGEMEMGMVYVEIEKEEGGEIQGPSAGVKQLPSKPRNEPEEKKEKPRFKETDIPGLRWVKYPSIWNGRLRFGLDSVSGNNDRFRMNLENTIRIQREKDTWGIFLRYEYETRDDGRRQIRDRYSARLRWDYELSDNTFFQAETSYQVDKVKRINHEARQTLGYGWKVSKPKKYEFQLVPGFSAAYLDQDRSKVEDWTLLLRLFQAYNYEINKYYSINQSFEGVMNPKDFSEYDLTFRVGLLGSLTQQLALELDYEYEWDTRVGPGISERDSRIGANVIYRY
jgi:putative salt-induced outer membrane protein YdiY